MRRGAIAVLDALGFKGIWRRKDPAAVRRHFVNASDAGRRWAHFYSKNANQTDDPTELHFRFWSDSVIVATIYDPAGRSIREIEHVDKHALVHAFGAVASFLHGSVNDANGIGLSYRGAIATGEFDLDGDFVIGPAVDEAAELHELADAAIVLLSPAVTQFVCNGPEFERPPVKRTIVTDYPIPLKDGRVLRSHAINPLAFEKNGERRREYIRFLLENFTGDVGVHIKAQNTRTFLEHADELLSDVAAAETRDADRSAHPAPSRR